MSEYNEFEKYLDKGYKYKEPFPLWLLIIGIAIFLGMLVIATCS
jgi:hypothetical protein